jgi:hypothetical protein
VLAGAVRGRFGQSHKIMVALGMKSTTVTDDDVTAYAREHYRNT